MHGRLKVKNSAQQEAEKKARREEEMKIYESAMNAIFATRKEYQTVEKPIDENSPEVDKAEQEESPKKPDKTMILLKTTGAVLMNNPDITTLWNIRKEVVGAVLMVGQPEENDALLKRETELTVSCLAKNPKSYGAWHHRCWSLLKMQNPNWGYEMMLCNKYLSMDERNFHCWDYRRFVVKHANISAEDELEYSLEKIHVNFSNYSAWHYRSKLLPLTHGNPGQTKITEAKRREELDLVLNAAFTDPDDSSAWFYHKWLLGGQKNDSSSSQVPVMALLKSGCLQVAFDRPVNSSSIKLTDGNEAVINVEWKSANGSKYDTLWVAEIDRKTALLHSDHIITLNENQVFKQETDSEMDQDTLEVLESELSNCNELLDLEPDSKWTLYTKVLILKTIDKHHEEIFKGFEKLCVIDSKRRGYYQDQRSKAILSFALSNSSGNTLDLSNKDVTCLYFKERLSFFEKINLSGNASLRSLKNVLPYLLQCQELVLDADQAKILDGIDSLKITIIN